MTTGRPAVAPAADASEHVAAIAELLRLMARALRAVQLYPANNATRHRAVDSARAALVGLWDTLPELALVVRENEFAHAGQVVGRDPERSSDSLPWLLYKDGVRELRLSPGFERDELERFLDILRRVRLASADEDDLITLLWSEEFAHLKYLYVDLSFESSALASSDHPPVRASHEVERETTELATYAAEHPSGIVDAREFDAALHFLSEQEMTYLQDEVRREFAASPRENVVAILFDIFDSQPDEGVRLELLGALDGMLVQLLAAADYRAAAYLLRELGDAMRLATDVSADLRARAADIPGRLSERAVLSQLLESIEESATAASREELEALFAQLRPSSLATVLAWANGVRSRATREALDGAIAVLVSASSTELARLVGHEDAAIAHAAARHAGTLSVVAAVAPLGRMLESGSPESRVVAAETLASIGSAGALQALERALDDPERDVRLTAVRALGTHRYRAALPRLESAVRDRGAHRADLTERMALFDAYGALCGDAGVGLLDRLLNGRNLLGRRADAEVRACAAMALGRVGTASASAALGRARDERDVVVRNAVGRAMAEIVA